MLDLGTVGFRDLGDFFAPQEGEDSRKQAWKAGLLLAATGASTAVLATRMGTLREKIELLGAASLMMANGGVMMARGFGRWGRSQGAGSDASMGGARP